MVAEARKRRDAQRAAHQRERARLAMVSDERKKTSKQIDPKRPIPNVRLGRPIHPDMDEVSTICAQQ